MYAVISTGGKQYRVQEGDTLKIESLLPEPREGDAIKFDKILMVGSGSNMKIGKPFVDGCTVSATVVAQGRHKKIEIIKFNRRKHHMKRQGHRQNYIEIKITAIS